MAGMKENSDWSVLYVEPPVVKTVIDLLEGYEVCRDTRASSEFLKIFFEGKDIDDDTGKNKLCSQIISKKDKMEDKPLRWRNQKKSINIESSHILDEFSTEQTQMLKSKNKDWECTYPEVCKINAENFQIKSEKELHYQGSFNELSDINSPDYPEKKSFRCVCISENESSSSGIHSDSDDFESNSLLNGQPQSFEKPEFSNTVEKFNVDMNTTNMPKKLSAYIPAGDDIEMQMSNGKKSFVPQSNEVKENNTEIDSQTFHIPKSSDEKQANRISLNIQIPNLAQDISTKKIRNESLLDKDQDDTTKRKNSDLHSAKRDINLSPSVNQPKNSMNSDDSALNTPEVNPLSEIKHDEEKFRSIIEIEDKDGKEGVKRNSEKQITNDLQCQVENRPTKCASFSAGKEYFELQPTIQKKPDYLFLRLDDDHKQAAIKMFLHILDYEEFIMISLKAFTKTTRPYIKINTTFFKVAAYLLFFNLKSFTFDGIKNHLIDPYPTQSSQFLDFITSDDYQKIYYKFLRFYDHDFVKIYAYDHVHSRLIKKMHEEVQKYVEKPTTTEIRRAEIIHKPYKYDKRGELRVSPSAEKLSPVEPHVASKATLIPKTTYNIPRNKFYKTPQEYEEVKLQRKKKREENAQQKHHLTFDPQSGVRVSCLTNTHLRRTTNPQVLGMRPPHGPHSKVCEKVASCKAPSKICGEEKRPDKYMKENSLLHQDVVDQTVQLPDICENTLAPMVCEGCHSAKISECIPHSHLGAIATFDRKEMIRQSQGEIQSVKHIDELDKPATDILKTVSKSPRDFSKVAIPVKPTAASVLREGACLRSNEIRTMQKLEWIASGGADCAAVEELLAKRREEQQQEELEALERKHLQGLLSHEEAILARQQLLVKQRENALAVKRQKEELEKLLEIFQREEEEKIKTLVEKTHSIEAAAREKPKEVQKMKSDSVQKMLRETKEKMAELQKQRQEELMQRIALIRELRALQGLSKMKHKEIDLTESAGLGLMGEMSIAELHERLNLLREELREEVERKRAKAQYFRTQMKQHVQETQKYINQQRLNRVPDISKVNKVKNTTKIESKELKQLREKLNETRKLRMCNTKDF